MARNQARNFHFHRRFSDTMGIVCRHIENEGTPGNRLLDIPAGAGMLSDRLRESGFEVVSADINRERDDYILADMNKELPFEDGFFDIVISIEGIEHLIYPSQFIREVVRVTRKGGRIYLSTPNIASFYSRLTFMCTGHFFQFWGKSPPTVTTGETLTDLGHITPMTHIQLRFLFQHYGAELLEIRGNKPKRKALLPIYLPFLAAGLLWIPIRYRKRLRTVNSDWERGYYLRLMKDALSLPVLFSRNIIMIFKKSEPSEIRRRLEPP